MEILQTITNAVMGHLWIIGLIAAIFFIVWILGIRFIPNNKVGIVEKILSKEPNKGTIIALNGEAGFQAELLRGGIHTRFIRLILLQ